MFGLCCKGPRRALAGRFKDPKDAFKIVIVRDMWLTGFDAPVLSTMYVDKPMRGHGLMQAIARVNRVFHANRSLDLLTPTVADEMKRDYGVVLPDEFQIGGIISAVDVVECVRAHASQWKFKNSWGWVLENPRRLPFRPCKGFVGAVPAGDVVSRGEYA